MNNTCSDKSPTNPNDNDLWYNTSDNNFYVFNGSIWEPVFNEDILLDTLVNKEEKEDPIKAHDRAMGII